MTASLTKITTSLTKIIAELADREAIRDCLMRYARSVDRIDEALMQSTFWEGATDDHITFSGPASAFIEQVIPRLEQLDQTSHHLGNILIEIAGMTANVETYFLAYHRLPSSSEGFRDLIVGGRYLDRMERREDEWRIGTRVVVIDWFRESPDSADWSNGFCGVPTTPGQHKSADPSYKMFAGDEKWR